MRLVAASAAEAELGALFLNTHEAKVIRLTLHELGYKQPPTPIHIDNTTAVGIVNNTIKCQQLCDALFFTIGPRDTTVLQILLPPRTRKHGRFPVETPYHKDMHPHSTILLAH